MSALDRYREIVDDFDALTDALERPLPTTGWVNTLKTDAETLFKGFEDAGVEYSRMNWKPDGFRLEGAHANNPGRRIEFLLGHMQIQEEAAMLPMYFMEPDPDDRIVDLCAAPGNKTAQIAVALQNRGTVIANDRRVARMRAIRNTSDRLGLLNLVMTNCDAANFPTPSERYDRVLADVPCSCQGTSRKNPDALYETPADVLHALVRSQRAILERAFRICRPGGRVIYATCTYAPEENEAVIDDAIARLPFEPEWISCKIDGVVSSPGLESWEGRQYSSGMHNAMRVWPHQNDTGGFFVAAWNKPERW
jgi:NOL1/NOP2/sun family putative RNA methylase